MCGIVSCVFLKKKRKINDQVPVCILTSLGKRTTKQQETRKKWFAGRMWLQFQNFLCRLLFCLNGQWCIQIDFDAFWIQYSNNQDCRMEFCTPPGEPTRKLSWIDCTVWTGTYTNTNVATKSLRRSTCIEFYQKVLFLLATHSFDFFQLTYKCFVETKWNGLFCSQFIFIWRKSFSRNSNKVSSCENH